MNFGYNTFSTPKVNAFHQSGGTMGKKEQSAASMQFIGYDNTRVSPNEREYFDLKTIKMPKMVVKNLPKNEPWGKGGHWVLSFKNRQPARYFVETNLEEIRQEKYD